MNQLARVAFGPGLMEECVYIYTHTICFAIIWPDVLKRLGGI